MIFCHTAVFSKVCRMAFSVRHTALTHPTHNYDIMGYSLAQVGLFFQKPIFNHEQLYVAISRVTSHECLEILVYDDDDVGCDFTVNDGYKDVFQNL